MKILSSDAPYYTVLVEFDDQSFQQTLVSSLLGADLQAQLLEYEEEYAEAYRSAEC